jgi:hypothetical protein
LSLFGVENKSLHKLLTAGIVTKQLVRLVYDKHGPFASRIGLGDMPTQPL